MPVEVVGLIVAVVLGTPAGWWGWREFFHFPRKARQEVLDRLREPPTTGLNWQEDKEVSFQDKVDGIVKSGMDATDLRARFALPDRHLWKAIQHLYRENRIDVFLLKGTMDNCGHPSVPPCSELVLPIFVRRALPPEMRPERSEVEKLLSRFRNPAAVSDRRPGDVCGDRSS